MTDTRHLDKALEILKGDKGAKRARGPDFTLQVGPLVGILQGPRGKTVKVFQGTADEQKEQAKAHAAKLGKTLEIYE